MTEKQLREKIVNLFEHYVRRDDNDEPIWYIDNGDSFYGTIYEVMQLFTNQIYNNTTNINSVENNIELLITKLHELVDEHDTKENNHLIADMLLLSYIGNTKVTKEFVDIDKRY